MIRFPHIAIVSGKAKFLRRSDAREVVICISNVYQQTIEVHLRFIYAKSVLQEDNQTELFKQDVIQSSICYSRERLHDS